MRNISFLSPLVLIIVLTSINFSQSYYGINLDTVKAQRFDMGKMWTFENPPVNYLKETYNMDTKADWFDKLQKSALKFGNGCSASFISEDGLIMTNHHCVRGVLYTVQKDGENILKNGFYATTKEEERTVPNLKVEQLMFIKDITGIISIAMNGEGSAAEKIKMRDARIDEIKNEYAKENPELTYKVVSLYNGGKYSLYGYKVYTDIRLVFVPELFVAKLGGDPDNFTYPRYGLDCAFLRAYENGKPIKPITTLNGILKELLKTSLFL